MVPADVTGVILCGGDARRMDGVDKALQLLAGRPLVTHVFERLVPQVGRIAISANRSLSQYAAVSDTVVTDVVPGLGPLGGVVSVLDTVATPWVFCCPGDAPFLPVDLVQRLSASVAESVDVLVPHDGVQRQPLFMLMRTTERDSLAAYLAEGGRSVHGWLDTQRTSVVAMPDLAAGFLNINSWDELARASGILDAG